MSSALIIGAGKIARGFIGQLLFLSGFHMTFVDVSEPMVQLLNARGAYHVHVLGDASLDSVVTGYSAQSFADAASLSDAFWEASVVFVSVGGKNLPAVGQSLATMFNQAGIPHCLQNIVVCENWKNAAETLRQAIREHLDGRLLQDFDASVGVTEAVMMRTATQPDEKLAEEHPEDVWVQSYWHLPIDRSRLIRPLPEIKGVDLLDNFGDFLLQKMYTNNTSNAVIAYNGYLLGYRFVADAANSREVSHLLDEAYREINDTLVASLGVDKAQQEAFSSQARSKYCDHTIVDTIVRHGKDPLRKLGPEDRLIGPSRMALDHGIDPKVIIDTIAAALFLDAPGDESAQKLARLRRQQGIPYILQRVCELDPYEELYGRVLASVDDLRAREVVVGHE